MQDVSGSRKTKNTQRTKFRRLQTLLFFLIALTLCPLNGAQAYNLNFKKSFMIVRDHIEYAKWGIEVHSIQGGFSGFEALFLNRSNTIALATQSSTCTEDSLDNGVAEPAYNEGIRLFQEAMYGNIPNEHRKRAVFRGAFRCLHLAAQSGHARAIEFLIDKYARVRSLWMTQTLISQSTSPGRPPEIGFFGLSVDDLVNALSDLAERGVPEAQYQLAIIFTIGILRPKDLETSKYWVEQAARQGHALALDALETFSWPSTSEPGQEE